MFRFDVQIQFGLRQEFFFAHQAIGVDGIVDADGYVAHLDEMTVKKQTELLLLIMIFKTDIEIGNKNLFYTSKFFNQNDF